MDDLVSTEWLAGELGAGDLAIVDCSAFMPDSGRDARAEFQAAHIPGARLLDINAVRDTANPAPHMLPSAAEFGRAMEALGVGRDERIVVYDNSPLRTAARGWFMLRHFGARRVAILDGGFQKWCAEGRPVESGPAGGAPGQVRSGRDKRRGGRQGRGAERRRAARRPRRRPVRGQRADPRPGVAPGHIPGSRNVPFGALYRDDGTFRSRQEIAQAFAAAGADPHAPFTATCGSGVTANSLIFAAHLLGNDSTRLYDGSWSEWGADPSTPKALGPA
jgi:thiosulfate/3-mercaptopyruvate sulfurtransferase